MHGAVMEQVGLQWLEAEQREHEWDQVVGRRLYIHRVSGSCTKEGVVGVMDLREGEVEEVKLNLVPGGDQACFLTLTSPEVAQRVLRGGTGWA